MRKAVLFALPFLAACGDDSALTSDEVLERAGTLEKPQPGLYATTTELVDFEVPGLAPQQADRFREQMEGMSSEQQPRCLTAAQAERGFEDMLKSIGEDANGMSCAFDRFDVDAPNLSADLGCDGPMGAGAQIGFAGTTDAQGFDLAMDMEASAPVIPGGTMQMRFKVTSQRIGECSEADIADGNTTIE